MALNQFKISYFEYVRATLLFIMIVLLFGCGASKSSSNYLGPTKLEVSGTYVHAYSGIKIPIAIRELKRSYIGSHDKNNRRINSKYRLNSSENIQEISVNVNPVLFDALWRTFKSVGASDKSCRSLIKNSKSETKEYHLKEYFHEKLKIKSSGSLSDNYKLMSKLPIAIKTDSGNWSGWKASYRNKTNTNYLISFMKNYWIIEFEMTCPINNIENQDDFIESFIKDFLTFQEN